MIRYLKNNEIDIEKWDDAIDRAFNGLIYAYSWYLDMVSDEWDAIVEDDYQFVFPLVNKKKFGISYIYNPFFVQQLGLFGIEPSGMSRLEQFIDAIPSSFKHIEINLNHYNFLPSSKELIKNRNYVLSLTPEYDNLYRNYSNNLKRNLKKSRSSTLTFVDNISPESVVDLFKQNRGINLKSYAEDDYRRFTRLTYQLIHRGNAFTVGMMDEHNQLSSAAIFFKSHQRLVFIFSGLSSKGKQQGAMPKLIDEVIRRNSNKNLLLDFEGSNDKNLARFYSGFGADEVDYYSLHSTKIPSVLFWLKNKLGL